MTQQLMVRGLQTDMSLAAAYEPCETLASELTALRLRFHICKMGFKAELIIIGLS